MNSERLRKLADTVRMLRGPAAREAATAETDRLKVRRTNEPLFGWTRHDDACVAATMLPTSTTPPPTEWSLNLKVAFAESNGQRITGLTGLAIRLFETEATAFLAERARSRPETPTVLETAAAAIEAHAEDARQALCGPNWLGEAGAWLTPKETAWALERMADGAHPNAAWDHVDRAGVAARHEAEHQSEYLLAWCERMIDARLLWSEPGAYGELLASTMAEIAQLHPWGRIDPSARIGRNAVIGAGARVGAAAIGDRTATGARAVIGDGAVVEAGATIAPEAHIGRKARIGENAEARSVGEGTTMEASAKASAPIGRRCRVGEAAQVDAAVGEGSRIGNDAVVEVPVGRDCAIGNHARVEGRATWLQADAYADEGANEHEALADGSVIEENCTIEAGWMGRPQLRLGAGTRITARLRLPDGLTTEPGARIESIDDVIAALAKAKAEPRIHETASVDATARIGAGCRVGAGATIGERSVIGPGAEIGDNAEIGDEARIEVAASIERNAGLGCRVHIGEQSVIEQGGVLEEGARVGSGTIVGREARVGGTVGYGRRIGHHATVKEGAEVENDAKIGAGASIDAGVRVRRDAEIDRLTEVGADSEIGAGCVIGPRCRIGGRAAIGPGGHIGARARIAAGARIGARARIDQDARVGRVLTRPGAVVHANQRIEPGSDADEIDHQASEGGSDDVERQE